MERGVARTIVASPWHYHDTAMGFRGATIACAMASLRRRCRGLSWHCHVATVAGSRAIVMPRRRKQKCISEQYGPRPKTDIIDDNDHNSDHRSLTSATYTFPTLSIVSRFSVRIPATLTYSVTRRRVRDEEGERQKVAWANQIQSTTL